MAHHQVAQEHRHDDAGREEVPLLVDDRRPVGISVQQQTHVRPMGDDRLLAGISPRVARLGVDAAEVLARLDVNLYDLAAQLREKARKVPRAGTAHRVNDDARVPTRDGVTVDQLRKVRKIGSDQVAFLEGPSALRRVNGDGLLYLIEEAPRYGPSVPAAHEQTTVFAGELARRDDDGSVRVIVLRAAPGDRRRGARDVRDLHPQTI